HPLVGLQGHEFYFAGKFLAGAKGARAIAPADGLYLNMINLPFRSHGYPHSLTKLAYEIMITKIIAFN
ncbi:MAG: hypothetical protein NTW80_08080, partial [Deltaproteobacteria bacterium]|nr:hypothetical protein [Deltaproteobacteria bacterium]